MKTRSLVVAIFTILCFQGYAQLKGFSLGPYVEGAKPIGHFGETHGNGLGAGLSADVRLGKFGLTGSVGYMHFAGKTINTIEGLQEASAINAIPIRAGIKYRLVPVVYVKLEGGMAKYTEGDGSDFILSPGIGLRILGLDVQAKYETWINNGTRSFWGLKAGYNF